MQMDTRIPMMGQQPDFVNTLARSTRAAQLANQNRDQNALRQLFQTQGPQIMAGEGNALNALAQIDPNAALGIQGARQDMTIQRERLDLAREASAREVARYAMDLEEGQRKQFKEATRALVGMLSVAQTPEQFEQAKQRAAAQYPGFDTSQYTFDDMPMVVAELEGAAAGFDLVERRNPVQKPADEYQRYFQEEAQAGRKPLTRIEFEQAKKGRGLDIQLADGTRITEGGAADAAIPQMNVEQGKNTGFLIRMNDANDTLNDLEDQGLNFWQQNADSVPLGLGNYFRTPEFQRFDQARRDFVNALLRRESGAVISDQEFDNAEKQYFPVPGDSPEVIAQKRKNRENAIRGIRASSGPGAGYADQLKRPQATQNQQATAPQPGVTEDGYRFLGGDPGDPKNWRKVD